MAPSVFRRLAEWSKSGRGRSKGFEASRVTVIIHFLSFSGSTASNIKSSYVKTKISLAPSNLSAWNYLRGVLKHTRTPFSELVPFVIPYTASDVKGVATNAIDLEDPAPSQGAELPCSYAIEFLADALAREGY